MRIPPFIIIAALTLALVGCGGTYVDDKRNFERAFQAKCPKNVEVIRSVYSRTPHFTEEHEYYFLLKPGVGSDILNRLTSGTGMARSTNQLSGVPFYLNLRQERPKWFVANALGSYDIWYHTNVAFIVLRDKRNAEIFVYGSVGM